MRRPGSMLALKLAGHIVDLIGERRFARGAHLTELALAAELRVSRSPVREALRLLESLGAVEAQPRRGFFLRHGADGLDGVRRALAKRAEDAPYLRIAQDRLAGLLPHAFSEADLMRRYRVSRASLGSLLARMAAEGWIERRPGYGWSFLPMMSSAESHALGYRFRMAIEPAAILEPSFRVDHAAFARCRAVS